LFPVEIAQHPSIQGYHTNFTYPTEHQFNYCFSIQNNLPEHLTS